MQNPIDKLPVGPEGNVLEPNMFWTAIEKVLLNTSHDERKRARHNLSAICRGYAMSPQQYKKQPKRTRSIIDSYDISKELGQISKNNKIRSKSTDMYSEVLQVGDNKTYVNGQSHVNTLYDDEYAENKPAKTETDASQAIDIAHRKKDLQQGKQLAYTTPRKTKSECRVEDAKVVQLKDAVSGVPYCERLWRFAIINRQFKNNFKEAFEPGIPSARSNEAIYKGLMQKLKEEKKKEEKINKKNKKESLESVATVIHQSDENKQKTECSRHKRVEKLVTAYKFESPNVPSKVKESDVAKTKSLTLVTRSKTRDSPGLREELQLKSEIEIKKSFHDSVVRKRLSCGHQLKAIFNDVVCNRKHQRNTLNPEIARKYNKLKTDYMSLFNQESSLRQQIAALEAKMQNKAFHKRSKFNAVQKITLVSKSAKLSHRLYTPITKDEAYSNENVSPLPHLKTSRPLIVPQNISFEDKNEERSDCKEITNCTQKNEPKSSHAGVGEIRSEKSKTCFPSITGNVRSRSVCSFNSLTPELEVPVKRLPVVLIVPDPKISYRLPKVNRHSMQEFLQNYN